MAARGLAAAAGAGGAEPPLRVDAADSRLLVGGPLAGGKAAADSVYLMGGPDRLDGKFQSPGSAVIPDEQGWTGADYSALTTNHWRVSEFNAELLDVSVTPNHAMHCGEIFASCGPGDPPEGYGNAWASWLDWYGTASNPTSTNVRVTARLNHDVETGYDLVGLQVERSATGMVNAMPSYYTGVNKPSGNDGWTDPFVPVDVDVLIVVPSVDYVGPSHDQVHLRWVVTSDSGYSDQDCGYAGFGACQLDNITVSFDNVVVTHDDFETSGKALGWMPVLPPGVGDFSKVWPRLHDLDPCHENSTAQFAFIDDGLVVSGTGGTLGVTWTYGPGGYVVNNRGGLAGEQGYLNDEIFSPPIPWPGGQYDGAVFSFDVYAHLPATTGVYYTWNIRSSDDGGVTWSLGSGPGFVYFSNTPRYYRSVHDVTSMLLPGCNMVQVSLGVMGYGTYFHFSSDTTPAPYFDNVQLVASRALAPKIVARDVDVFQDGFPASGTIGLGADLGGNSVRLDMARNISPRADMRNDPGDSIIVDVKAGGAGAVLTGPPELHVRLRANPLFDPYRTLPAGFARSGALIDGTVAGDSTFAAGPPRTVVANRWHFDLPDTGFFFPGDVLHWYVKAQDEVGGGVRTACLPADTTGWSALPGMNDYLPLRYPSSYVVRALPSLSDGTLGTQRRVLFWNDAGASGYEDEWLTALQNSGWQDGRDFDVFTTQAPGSGVGNGLGGRATAAQLAGYQAILYSCGTLQDYLIGNGDYSHDPSRDVQVLEAWFALADKNAYFSGEDLCYNLQPSYSGALTGAFLADRLGVQHYGADIRAYIGNQSTPWVKPVAGNAAGLTADHFAFGGCPVLHDFDRIRPVTGASTVLEWTSPTGATGYSTYAAGVLYYGANNSRVLTTPYDFGLIYDQTMHAGGMARRTELLSQILTFFGNLTPGESVSVPEAGRFSASSYPNPFNPKTTIAFNLPRDGQVELKIYNVRGELVRTLIKADRTAGFYAESWDGQDASGHAAASGVYFCEVRAAGETKLLKLVLVR